MIAEHLNLGQQRAGRVVRFEYDANRRLIRYHDQGSNIDQRGHPLAGPFYPGKPQWGLIAAPDGGIMGVYSLSNDAPIKTAGFSARDRSLEGKVQYTEWRFVYEPAPVRSPAATPDKPLSVSEARAPVPAPMTSAPAAPAAR